MFTQFIGYYHYIKRIPYENIMLSTFFIVKVKFKLLPIDVFLIVLLLLFSPSFQSCQSASSSNKPKSNVNENEVSNINRLKYMPTSTAGQIINHTYFTASYSENDEQPEWVAYKITSENFNNHIGRTNDYREDPSVLTKSATPNDYRGSGYDMGHLAPAQDMAHNKIAMSESFYLSNISPQRVAFNRGIWKTLEGKVKYWATFNDSIYVVTGPILDNPIEKIGENKVSVPRAFYKTLLAFNKGKIKAIAFMLPNEKSDKSIYSYAVSIDEVEALTGINFYQNLNIKIQDSLEAKKDIKSWISIK